MRESFKDYVPEEWEHYDIEGWQIWRAGDAPSPLDIQAESWALRPGAAVR